MKTLEEFKKYVEELGDSFPNSSDFRYGQKIFNGASNIHEIMIEDLVGTEVDPFYNNKAVDTFIDIIYKRYCEYYERLQYNGMTNKELIEKLQKYPEDAIIYTGSHNIKSMAYNKKENLITIG